MTYHWLLSNVYMIQDFTLQKIKVLYTVAWQNILDPAFKLYLQIHQLLQVSRYCMLKLNIETQVRLVYYSALRAMTSQFMLQVKRDKIVEHPCEDAEMQIFNFSPCSNILHNLSWHVVRQEGNCLHLTFKYWTYLLNYVLWNLVGQHLQKCLKLH